MMGTDGKVSMTAFESSTSEHVPQPRPNDESKKAYGPTELRYISHLLHGIILRWPSPLIDVA